MHLLTRAAFAAITSLAAGIPLHGLAQGYPSRPVTLVYPYSAGSGPDTIVRTIASAASSTLGQAMVVENRPGAAGRNGLNALKTARNDGYFIVAVTSVEGVVQGLANPEFALEPYKDYAPITLAFETPMVLAANPSVPFRDLKGLIAYAKASPGKLNVGTSGAGGSVLLAIEILNAVGGIDLVPVHYKGVAPAVAATLAGDVQLTFSGGTVKPHTDAGKLVSIVTTGDRRWSLFPAAPTLIESGINFQSAPWIAMIAPAGTAPDVTGKLNQAFVGAMKTQGGQGQAAERGCGGRWLHA